MAYRETPEAAFPRKKDVDEAFFRLATLLLSEVARRAGPWTVFGTHDPRLIRRITEHAASTGEPKDAFEFDLLNGIYCLPWNVSRLAERPANLWFLARNAPGG